VTPLDLDLVVLYCFAPAFEKQSEPPPLPPHPTHTHTHTHTHKEEEGRRTEGTRRRAETVTTPRCFSRLIINSSSTVKANLTCVRCMWHSAGSESLRHCPLPIVHCPLSIAHCHLHCHKAPTACSEQLPGRNRSDNEES
jgi:hypothetical protein